MPSLQKLAVYEEIDKQITECDLYSGDRSFLVRALEEILNSWQRTRRELRPRQRRGGDSPVCPGCESTELVPGMGDSNELL